MKTQTRTNKIKAKLNITDPCTDMRSTRFLWNRQKAGIAPTAGSDLKWLKTARWNMGGTTASKLQQTSEIRIRAFQGEAPRPWRLAWN